MRIKLSDHFSYKKLLIFTLPSIGMMIFVSIYSVIDGYFVSNYAGNISFASINLIFPFLMLFSAIGFMVGSGGTALIAYHLGTGDIDKANQTFSLLTYLIIITGIIVTIIGQIALEKVAIFLGATKEMLPYCVLYGRIIFCSITPFMLQNLFQSFLVVAEKPQFGFLITLLAGITNIVGDYVLVDVLKMGVKGAAIATMLSQCVGGLIPLVYFIFPNSSLLRLGKTKFSLFTVLKTAGNGSSEFVTNISLNIISMIYNIQLMKYAGENGVSAFGVVMYVSFVFVAIFLGYSMGVAPIVSYNYGAKKYDELKNIYNKSRIIIVIFSIGMFALSEGFSRPLSALYVGYDDNLMKLTENAFRIYSTAFLVVGINIFASSFFTALNNGKISAIISFVRTFGFQILSVFVLSSLFKINGIWWATFVAEVFALFVSGYFLFKMKKVYNY